MTDALFDLPSQPALLPQERAVRTVESSIPNPVARVVLDTPFSWPDKLYDYMVPEKFAEAALPGTRVRVEFGSKRLTGFIRERGTTTDSKRLRNIVGVLGEPVVTEEIFQLAEAIAARQVCSLHDVLRGAIPSRHARAAKAIQSLPARVFQRVHAGPESGEYGVGAASGASYLGAESRISGVGARGGSSRTGAGEHLAESLVLGGEEVVIAAGRSLWSQIAGAARIALSREQKVLIVVPTAGEVEKLKQVLSEQIPGEPIGILGAHLSAETRYRHFLSIVRGRTRLVIGTRTAAFAPVEAGLLIVVDELNGAMRDKRSPYMWADDVLRMRKGDATYLRFCYPPRMQADTPLFVAGGPWPRVTRVEQWAGDQRGLLPSAAFEVIRDGLKTGPVIISAPRGGYVPALACARCGRRAVCQHCGSSIAVPSAGNNASCMTCGAKEWVCECGSVNLRAVSRGSERLAQEVALAFPNVGVDSIRSGTETSVSPIVIATPGAEPDREFAAGVIVDAGARLASLSLDAEVEAVGRWSRIASRVSGQVLLAGGVPEHLARALATRSIDFMDDLRPDRELLGQPPYHRWFLINGQRSDVQRLLGAVASRLEGETPPDTGIAAMLSGGGRQVFAEGIHLVGPVEDNGLTLYLHEQAPAERLARVLRDSLQELGQMQVRVEADPIL